MSALQISGLSCCHMWSEMQIERFQRLSGKCGIKTLRTTQINYNDFDQHRVRFSSKKFSHSKEKDLQRTAWEKLVQSGGVSPSSFLTLSLISSFFLQMSYIFCLGLMLCSAVVQAIELHPEPDHGPVAYEFHWSVNDPHTGDIKSQKETRKDDQVQGQYSLVDSDGYLRIVEYTSDAHNGFNALVRREPTDIKIPQPAPEPKKLIATKILGAPTAPLVHYSSAPKAVILKAEAPSEGNYVSVSGPTAQYKY